MFKYIIIVIIIIVIIILWYFKKDKKLYLKKDIIKYPLIKKGYHFKKKDTLSLLKKGDIFYTIIPWKSKNGGNYFLYNKRYYIIEPGYYYQYLDDSILNISKDITVNKI